VLPNAFIVGVEKAGTTALYNALSRHPEVTSSHVKETHFFDPLRFGEPLPEMTEYQQMFPPGNGNTRITLEATPGYFTGGTVVAEAIRKWAPNGKAVIVLRDPTTRAFSWWRFVRSRLRVSQNLSFEEYLQICEAKGLEPERHRGLGPWRALSGGRYELWLAQWMTVFGEDLLVLFHEDLRTDGDKFAEQVAQHFELDAEALVFSSDNASTDITNASAQRMALAMNAAGDRFWTRAPWLKSALRRGYYALNARDEQAVIALETQRWLNEYYATTRAEVARELGRVPLSWTEGKDR